MGESLRHVTVKLDQRSYTILIGYNILPRCIAKLQEHSGEKDVFIVTDSNVDNIYGENILHLLHDNGYSPFKYVIPAGEETKSWLQAELILRVMLERNLSRKTCLLALGGGVVGDLAGFTAAIYRRGVPLFQVPTTLLGQVDSSIGGKVAVNHPLGKNMLGTFYQPREVWSDLSTLNTLPHKEWQAGLAEVVKYGLIWDENFFAFLENNTEELLKRDPEVIPHVVESCCRIKAEIVSRDELDEGLRNILNLGHTIGHALESATHYKKYRHGEAVSIGMMGAFLLAEELGIIGEDHTVRLKALLKKLELPVSYPAYLAENAIAQLKYDKKATAKSLMFVLPNRLGEVELANGLSGELIRKVMKELAD